MSPVAEYIKNVGKSVAYAAYDYTTSTMPATSEFVETNNELFSDVYHSVLDLRRTMNKAAETIQNTPLYRHGTKAFHNAMEDIKSGNLYNSEREDSVMGEAFNMDDDFSMDNFDSGDSSSGESSMTIGEKSIMAATQESANQISHTTASAIEASTKYSVDSARQNATMLYAQSIKTNATLEGGFKAVTAGLDAMYKFNTEVVQTMANNSKIYFETTTKIMQENNAILKEMLEMQRNLYKRDTNAKSSDDPLFAIMGANGGIDIKAYGQQLIKNAKSLISDKTMGMSDMISEDMLKQVAANPLQGIPSLMIATALGPSIKSTMQNLDKTLGGMFGSFISKMNYMASQNSWGGSLGKEIMGKLFGVQLSAKESINTSDINSKITPMERSVVEVIPSHLSRIEAALTGNPARVYDAKKGKWTNMAAIKSGFKKDKEDAIRSAGSEETSEMKDIMNKLVEQQAMNSEQVKHMEEVIQKINRKRFDDGGWLDRKGTTQDKAMRYGVSEEEWNLFEQLYSNVSRGARANAPGKFMRERLERNRKLKNAEASGNDVLRLLFNDFDPANSMHIDSKKLQETGGTLGQNILETKDKHGMTVFDYLRDIDLNTMYGGGGGSRRSRRKGADDRSLREQELANRHANGMREGAAAGGDSTITTADAGNESDNSRQINNLNINQADLISAAGAVKDARREQQMEENRTFITKYINEKMATEVQKMKANGASAQEIAAYRESMKKMVDAASDGGRFGAMTEAIQHLTARPVGVITGIMEQADKHIFNTLFEEEDRDDKDEEGKPAKGFFGKLKNRLDEMFEDIKEKINKRDEEIGNANLSLFQKANSLIKEMTGVDVGQNLKNMKQGIIDTGKSAFNQVKGALEGTAKDIGLESWVDKLGRKKDNSSDNASQTSTAADGARNVTKTGLTILSKGERVIPADQNVYNPDMRKVNRAENRRDEAQIKRQLMEQIRGANMMADGGTIDANGKAVKDNTKEKSMFAQFGERLGIWDSDNDKKITSMTQKEVEKHLPAVAGGGTAGAVLATATGLGGPLVGAIAGAAINIAANSESFQKRLFGERIYDETTGADTGKRKGGIFGQEIQDTMKKYLPDAKKYGITGSLLGLVTPLGPIGGMMMGGAISFLKNNDKAKNTLFGENGLIGKDAQKTLRKAFPAVSKTAIAGLLAGGMTGIGLIPGALVGAGIGLVSTTDEFKDFLLGKPDKDGKRVGGVAGAIKEGLVDPLKSVGQSVKDNFLDWFKTKMTKPIVDAMAPMGKQLQLGVTGVFKWGKDLAKRLAGSRTGIGLLNRVKYSKAGRAAGWLGGKAFGAVKGVGSAAKWAIERPSAIIGGVGDRLRKSQIKSGNADYMTAEERLKFMGDENYDMRSFDESINGTTNEGIEEIRKKFGEIDEGKDFLEKEHTAQMKKMGKHVVKGIKDTGRATQIMDAIRSGNMERAVKLVESSKMGQRDKAKMLEFINEEGEKLRDIAMRKDNFKADRGEMFKQLEKMGMKGINEDNYEKYKKYFETEAAKRSKQDEANADALDTTDPAAMQAAEINMTLKTGFDEQIPLLQQMTDYLSQMVAGQGGMTPDQAKALQGMKQAGLKAESDATKNRARNARKKSNVLNRAFGGTTEITAENQLNLLDMKNSERKRMMRIADNGLQLDDVNKILELKGKDKDRWFALAEYGYNITDTKLISGMSNRDFDKLLILAKAGIPITNIKAISKYDERECELMAKMFGQGMEIAQGGLYEFARKGEMTKDDFATKKSMVNSLEGSYEERIGLNRQEGVEQFSRQHTKQSKLARMGESMKDSAQGMAHDAMADVEQKVYAKTHGYNNKNRKSGAINNAGLARKGTGAIKSIVSGKGVNVLEGMSTEALAAVAASPAAIPGRADGGKATKDEVAVVSKGERIEPADSDKEKEAPDKAQAQKKESELEKATKEAKKDKKKSTSTVNTEYGPQEYKMSSDGSMVVAKTKQSMAVQKRILDRDNTQKELLASIKELVATNKESLKNSLAGAGKKAKKGLFDLLKDLNPLNMLKKFGGVIASVLGPLAPLVLKGAGALGGLAMKGIKWAGGKVLDGAKAIGSKVMNTKIGQKIANSKVGKFASKIGGKLFGSKSGGDLDTSTPTNEMEAITIHGSNIEKLLTKILNALEGNDGGADVPDISAGGRKRRKKGGKKSKGKKGKGPSAPADVATGGKKKGGKGRAGKLLALGGGIAAGLGLSSLFGGSDDDEDNDENGLEYAGDAEDMDDVMGGMGGQFGEDGISDIGAGAMAGTVGAAAASQMALANNNSSTMDTALDAGANAMYTKDAADMASKKSSKFANAMNKGKDAVGQAANATKENTLAIVQKVKSGFNTVISKCGTLLGGAAEKLTAFKDWIIKKITTPASMKKILAKAGKHAAAYGASATGIGVVVTVGMEVGFAMSAFYDGYNDADRILQIPAGTATTGMKMLCGFVSAALQAIPIIGWVLEPEDVIQGAISTVGAVFGVTEDVLNQVRKVGDKADKGISQVTNKIAETAQKAQSAASSVFSNFAGYGQDLLNQGKEKAQSVWDKFTGYGSDLVNKAGGMVSKAANWVKDKAGAAVQGAKDMAKSAYNTAANMASGAVDAVKSGAQKVGDAVSNEYEYAKNKVKSLFGYGKYGRGKWGRGFQSQQDPSIAGESFNVAGDTAPETVDERACAETTGVNVLSALGMPTSSNDVLDAVDFAAGRGHVAPDDGTKDTFFKDYLGQYGVQTRHINPNNAANTNNPVILMGKDKSNTPDKESQGLSKTPYGDQPHYVLGMGTDKDGNMTVVDPDTPDAAPQKYRASDVLSHSSLAIEAGMGKFNKSLGRKKWGKGPTIDEKPPFGSVASAIASKVGSDHPELFWAQMMVETGGPEAERKWMQDHPQYGDICNYGGFTWYPGMGEEYKGPPRPANEGGYYAKFKSDAEYADMAYRKVYQSYQDELKQAANAKDFAHILKAHGYYAGDEGDYAAGLQSRLDQYKDQLGALGKNMVPSGATGGPGGGNNASGGAAQFGGIFGDLAEAASALSGGFSLGSSGGNNNSKGPGSNSNNSTAGGDVAGTNDLNMNFVESNHPGDESTTNLKDINPQVKTLVNQFAENYFKRHGKKLMITGGAELGYHSKGIWSHGNGYKTDITTDINQEDKDEMHKMGASVNFESHHYDVDWSGHDSRDQDHPKNAIFNSTPPTEAKGKWRFGRGKDDNNVLAMAAANTDALAPKKTDDSPNPDVEVNDISKVVDYQTAMAYIQEVPPDQIPEYNKPSQDDSITVLRAKCKKIRETFEQKQQNGKGKKKSIWGHAKRTLSKNPVIKAFNEYMNGRGPRVSYGDSGKGKWGKGEGAHIWDYLKQKGLGSSAIAGIMGNMQAESSLEPNIVQGGGHADEITVDNSTGYGLCQWTSSDRQQGLVDFARSRGTKTSDTDTQLEYMLKEINDGYSGMLQKMDGMSPYDAALLFHKEYERSADTSEMAARRGRYAEEIAKSEGKGETFNGTYTGGPGGGGGAAPKKRGLFGKLTEMATALSDKMKKAIAPMAGAITSGAEKIFGKENISAIFGDTNPFSSIFSSPSGGGNGGGGNGGGGGSFASASSDEGIRKASEYAQSRVGTEGYGNNGCTTWCQVYLKQAGNPFADEMSLYVPTLMEQAKQKGIWKEADQPGCEGDIALLETIGTRDDGPDHAVIYDGRGGCWGNSSGKNKILHYDNMLASFPGGLWGYVATGNGGGTVATKEGQGQSAQDAALDSTLDGHGKWSGKWGKGRKRALRMSAAARAKYGKGLLDILKGDKRDPKKELEMQAKLVGNKGGDANDDHGIKTMEDVAAYIKDVPKASIPEYNRIKKGDSISVARAKAIKAKQMFEEQSSKDPKANPSIKMMEDVSKMSQSTLAQTNKPVVSDPDNPLSGTDGINSVESARQYISGLPEDYKNNIPKYNVINDDDSIMVARAKALKTMELYKKTAKNQPQETPQEAPAPAEGKGKWGRSWLSRIGGAIGDVATGLWKGISNPSTMGGIFGGITGINGPVVPFLKPLGSKDAKDKKSLADEFENDIKYIMSAKEWQGKDGRNPSRAEAIEILKKEEKYKGKINDDGTIKEESKDAKKTDDKKAENQKAAEKIDTSYTENDVTYIMTAREWQDSEGRNPSRAEAEKILQQQGKSGKGKWGRGFGSWLKRIGGSIGDAATGLWKGMTAPGGLFGGPVVPFLKPLGSKDEEKKKSLADEFENDIKYIMTAKEWQGKDGRNPSRAEAIEILKKEEKYKGKVNDDGTIKEESKDAKKGDEKKAENQKAAEKIDTSYTENDVTYIMTAREWQDSEGRNPSRAEAEKILQEQGKAGKGKWGRRRRKASPVVEQKKPSFWERITAIVESSRPNKYAKFLDDHGIHTMQDALDYVKDIPADFQAKYPDNIINPDATNGDSIDVARSKAIKMRELWEQENSGEGRGKWGRRRRRRNRVEQVTQPVNAVIAPSNPFQSEDNPYGLNSMQDCLNLQSTIPEEFIAQYPFNRIDPANDSLDVAKAKATKLAQLYDEQAATQMAQPQAPSIDIAPTETPKMTPMEQILDSIKDIPEDFIAKYPYNRIDPVNDSLDVAKAKANALRKLYDSQPAAGMGKWGRRRHHRRRKQIEQVTQPVNTVMAQAPVNPFQTEDNPYGLSTMQDCLNLQSTIPEEFIAQYPYNRIDPENDSLDVAKAKATKLGQLYDEQAAAGMGKWGRRRRRKQVVEQVTQPVNNVPAPTVQNQYQTEDNPYGLNTMQDCLNLQSTIPEDFIAQYPFNRIDPANDSLDVAKAKATKLAQLFDQQSAGMGKWGTRRRHRRHKQIEQVTQPVNDVMTQAPVMNPFQSEDNPYGLNSMQDCLNLQSTIPEDFIAKYPYNRIDPANDSLDVAKAKATKLAQLYDEQSAAGMGKWGTRRRHRRHKQIEQVTQPVNDVMTQAPVLNPFQTEDNPYGLNSMQDCLNLQSTIPEDFIAQYPFNRIDPANDSLDVAKAKATKLAQLYDEQSAAGMGKWGTRRRHRRRKQPAVIEPVVNNVPAPTVQNQYQTEDNPYGLNTMQDCLNLQSTIPEDFIAQYPYNRIDPENDSLDVAKAKATKLAQLFDQQPAAQGKWGRGFGSWLKRIGGSIGDVATQMWHNFTGQKQPVQPTTPEKKEKTKEEILENDIRYIMTAKEWQGKDGRNPSRAEAIAILNKDKKYDGSIDKDGKLIEKKTANDAAKEAVKNPGTVKTPTITNPDDIKTVDDAFNYISDIPEDFIAKYPFNKIDPEKDDLGVVKSKAIKLRKLYDEELTKSGTTKMESKMAAQTIDPNKPAETNTTEKNAQKTAEKAGIVKKKEEKATSTTKANDAASDDSGIKAPNGKNYSNNDINYLIKQGYSKEAAIEILSKDKKYAATPATTKTSDTKSADSSNATGGSGEYNDKFDTMINLLASIAQSVAVMAGTPVPQVAGATAGGNKGNTALQQKTDAKVQANRKAAAQVSGQNMQDMFAGIASAMQKLARG